MSTSSTTQTDAETLESKTQHLDSSLMSLIETDTIEWIISNMNTTFKPESLFHAEEEQLVENWLQTESLNK